MKVIFVSNLDKDSPYGASTRPYYLSTILGQAGHRVLHLCNRPPPDTASVSFVARRKYSFRPQVLRYFANMMHLVAVARQFNPDIIVGEQNNNQVNGLVLGLLLRKPAVYDAHSSTLLESESGWSATKRAMIKFQESIILRRSKRIVVVSTELRDYFEKTYGIPKEIMSVVYNGTNLQRPVGSLLHIKEKLGIGPDDKVVAFICPRFHSPNIQALEFFYEIVPLVESRLRNVKFLILGGGDEMVAPSANVIYTGFVEKLEDYLSIADAAVSPYPPTALSGGTRNKVADYLALGIPFVSTTEGVRGFDGLVDGVHFLAADTKEAFADRLNQVLTKPELAASLSKQSLEVARRYSWGHSAEVFETVLSEFLATRQQPDQSSATK